MIIPEFLLMISAGSLVFFLRQRGELNRSWGYRLLGLVGISLLAVVSAFLGFFTIHIFLQLLGAFLVLVVCWQYWRPTPQLWWGAPIGLWLLFLLFDPNTAVNLLYGGLLALFALTLYNQIEYSNTLLRSTKSASNPPPLLNNVFAHLPLGVIVTDGHLRIKIANQTAVNLLGVTEENLRNQILTTILPPLFAKTSTSPAAKAATKTIHINDHWLDCRLTPLETHFFLALQDVTLEKKMQKHQQSSLVAFSLEMRSPLTAVKAYIELLSKETHGPLNEAQQGFLAKVERGFDQMISLADSMMVILANQGKSDEGIGITAVDFIQIANQVVESLAETATQRQRHLSFDATDDSILAKIAPEHITTILQELLLASLEHSEPEDTIWLHGHVTPDHESAVDLLVIQVIGTGIGVTSEEHLALWHKLAEPLTKSQSLLNDETSLRLEIVRALVESYNGRLWFSNEPQSGNIFTVILPMQQLPSKPMRMLT